MRRAVRRRVSTRKRWQDRWQRERVDRSRLVPFQAQKARVVDDGAADADDDDEGERPAPREATHLAEASSSAATAAMVGYSAEPSMADIEAVEREALRSLREIRKRKDAKRAQEDAAWRTAADAIRADASVKAAAALSPSRRACAGDGLGAPDAPSSYVARHLSLAIARGGGGGGGGDYDCSVKDEAKAIGRALDLGQMLTFRFVEVRHH